VTVKDVCPHEFIRALAAHLKKGGKLKVPEWVDLVKTAKSSKGIGALETNFNGAARISPELPGASCSDGQEG